MTFGKKNLIAYSNFILGRYARLAGLTESMALPVYIFADPSSACNLRCAMCVDEDSGSGRKRPQAIMKPDVFESLVKDVGETLFMISLYNWGEPLLNRELPRFIGRAKEFDIYVDINTNLSLKLHDCEMEELLVSGPDSIVVSLDGFSPQSYQIYRRGGDFDLVKDNLVRMAALRDSLGLPTEIVWKYLVFSFNEQEVEEAERFSASKGITFSRKEAIIDVDKRPEWLPSYRRDEIHQKHGGWPLKRRSDPSLAHAGMGETCIWHYSLAAVNSDASLSPCCAVAEKVHEFGTIVPGKMGFKENWNSISYRSARSVLAGRGESSEIPGAPLCQNCPYPFLKDFSGGLDTMIRKDFTARFPNPDPLLAEAFRLFDSGEEFMAYVEQNYEPLSNPSSSLLSRRTPHTTASKPVGIPAGSGKCGICGNHVEFRLKQKGFSLRETVCPCCGGSRRSRDLAAVLLETFGAASGSSFASHLNIFRGLTIFEAQANGPMHEQLKKLPGYLCAEFLDDVAPGCVSRGGVRCENLEGLTFPDESFDLVITQDVLEHVSDPGAALREIARVLKPGGFHIFTVPLHERRMTSTRARQEENPVFILPPVYHGDPLRSSGSLVYTDFGDDLPALLSEFGFTTEFLRRGVFYNPEEIPALVSGVEHARYEELRKRGEHLKIFLYNSVVFRARRSALNKSQNERKPHMEQPCHQPGGSASLHPMNQMLDELLEVVRHEPVSAVGLVKIGESCFRYNLAAAAGFFQAALKCDPRCSDAMNNMGVMAFASGDHAHAESLFMDALGIAPDFREARQNLAQLYNEAPQLAARDRGNAVHCPCCGGFFPNFIAGGPSLRPKVCCPRCGSLERHRLLWLYLQEKTFFFTQRLKVLHVAPEPVFQERFRRLPNLDYISADIASPLAMVQMDITDIQFPDNTFDVILCNHVLEHVPDDRLAMRELCRVLKPDGWAILQVPIDLKREKTYEDPAIIEPQERRRHFGQEDHVRWYGVDYAERLAETGFAVSVRNFTGGLSGETIRSCGIIAGEEIFHCTKEASGMAKTPVVPIPPIKLRFMNETPAQFLSIGDALYRELRDYAGLTLSGKLLDVGSGYGRLAHAMIRSGDFQGDYTGVEILPIHSAWCRNNLTPLNRSFRFIHLDVLNNRYNPSGTILPKELIFSFPDAAFDVICLTSVFTHMYEEDILRYLTEIRRMLAQGGSAYVTFFLLNKESRNLLEAGQSSISMTRRLNEHTLFHNADDPLHAIAYDEDWLRSLIASTSLTVRATRYGTWCGRDVANLYQDTLILSHQGA